MRRLFPMWGHYIMLHGPEWPLRYPVFRDASERAGTLRPVPARGSGAGQRTRPERAFDQVSSFGKQPDQAWIALGRGQEAPDPLQQCARGGRIREQDLAQHQPARSPVSLLVI